MDLRNRPKRRPGVILLGGLLVWTLIAFGLAQAKRWVMQTYDTPEARAQWQGWVDHVRHEQAGTPPAVRRPVPRAKEPPLLILFRDAYWPTLAIVLAAGSILYAFLTMPWWMPRKE